MFISRFCDFVDYPHLTHRATFRGLSATSAPDYGSSSHIAFQLSSFDHRIRAFLPINFRVCVLHTTRHVANRTFRKYAPNVRWPSKLLTCCNGYEIAK